MHSLHLNDGSCHVKQPHPPSMPNKKLYPTPLASRMSSFIRIVVNLWECLADIGECVRIHKRKEEDSKAQASKAKQKPSQAKPNKQRIR
jgi:hypothetical protein